MTIHPSIQASPFDTPPVLAPHDYVEENYRADCVNTTGWTTSQWRIYAKLTIRLEEAKQEHAEFVAKLTATKE